MKDLDIAGTNRTLLDRTDKLLSRDRPEAGSYASCFVFRWLLGGFPSGTVNPMGCGSKEFLYPTTGSEAGWWGRGEGSKAGMGVPNPAPNPTGAISRGESTLVCDGLSSTFTGYSVSMYMFPTP